MEKILPYIPERPEKPRTDGITMVMDKGLSIREAEDFMSVGSLYTDFVKLGFGTSILTPGFREKIRIYKKNGCVPYPGGTLFEAFVVRNMFNEFMDFLDKNEFDLAEVSDGSYEIEHEKKLEYIRQLAARGRVISEVGSKKKNVIYSPAQWVSMMKSELEAGSEKVIAEARETGTIGIYNEDSSVNTILIKEIGDNVGFKNVVWEAPLKSQQVWFINNFGANVSLGNIAPHEIISLESLRCGLRGDTFFNFLPEGAGK